LIIYPPNTIDIAIDLPVDAPPRALRAAEAVVCPVPPLEIATAPLNCETPIVLLVNVVVLVAVTMFVGVMIDDSVVIRFYPPRTRETAMALPKEATPVRFAPEPEKDAAEITPVAVTLPVIVPVAAIFATLVILRESSMTVVLFILIGIFVLDSLCYYLYSFNRQTQWPWQ
jgi:hypothetical protein